MANSVAPIVNQMQAKDEVLNTFIPNSREIFLRKLNQAFEQRETYYLDFKVHYKQLEQCIFEAHDLSEYADLDVDVVESMLFHISYDDFKHEHLFEGNIIAADEAEFKKYVKEILF